MIVGVVGKANVGKSTFFKALTLADVEIANYPFATIKPNHGVGFVRVECADKEFDVQCDPREGFCKDHIRFVAVNVIDVAGLVPGAHEGKGMGNQFLDDLNQANVLIHVIDCSGSTNQGGEPVEKGSYDPAKDVKFLEEELDFWYLRILKKDWEKLARKAQQEHGNIATAIAKQMSGVGVNEDLAKDLINKLEFDKENPGSWNEEQLLALCKEFRKKTKPMVIAANKIDIPGAEENFERLKREFPEHMIIKCSAESELALKEAAKQEMIDYLPGSNNFKIADDSKLSNQQKEALAFIESNMLKKHGSTGVQDVLERAVFEKLGYMAVFPGGVNKLEDQDGNVLPDCFLMPSKTTVLDFAYRLHTDLGDNFIRAIDVRTKRNVGKEHKVEHRDVIEIVSGK